MSNYILVKNNTIVNNILSDDTPITEDGVVATLVSNWSASRNVGNVWNSLANDYVPPFRLRSNSMEINSSESVDFTFEFSNSIKNFPNNSFTFNNSEFALINNINNMGDSVTVTIDTTMTSSLDILDVNIDLSNVTNYYSQSSEHSNISYTLTYDDLNS
tara:strand:+ start:1196 stop:1672 length:477 start_codon:yes stop_codon:yes gene_type:complete